MTVKTGLLTDRQRAVVETMRMKLNEVTSMAYLKSIGHEMSLSTWYREKNKLEKMKLKRLYHIAAIGFQDQHLETIDQYEMGFKMMWQNVLRERNPYKQNSMIRDILLLKPYLSSYYEATKLIIEKQPNYHEEIQKRESNSIPAYTGVINASSDSSNNSDGDGSNTATTNNMVSRDMDTDEESC